MGADFANSVGAYLKWLDRIDPKTGTATLAVETRQTAYSALQRFIDAAKRSRSAEKPSKNLCIRRGAWGELGRQQESTKLISRDELGRVYRACVAEIAEVMATVRKGRLLIEAARDRIPAHVKTALSTRTWIFGLPQSTTRGPDCFHH